MGVTPCRWEASLCPTQFVASVIIAASYAPSLLHILSSQRVLFWPSLFGNNNPKCLEQTMVCRCRLIRNISDLNIARKGNFKQGKVRMGRILELIEFAVMSRFRRRNHKLANLEEWASRLKSRGWMPLWCGLWLTDWGEVRLYFDPGNTQIKIQICQ